MREFDEIITSTERLREIIGADGGRAKYKDIDHIDDVCCRFIAACPFVVVGSQNKNGQMSVSPRGDPAGFVKVLDEKTLAIPDRIGNNRLDTFENLFEHPEIGLIFMVPGHGDTLRVSGKGIVVKDEKLQGQLAFNGRAPHLALVVQVENAFFHCSKSMKRSRLWNPDYWPDTTNVPNLAEAMVAHSGDKLDVTADKLAEMIDERAKTKNLY